MPASCQLEYDWEMIPICLIVQMGFVIAGGFTIDEALILPYERRRKDA